MGRQAAALIQSRLALWLVVTDCWCGAVLSAIFVFVFFAAISLREVHLHHMWQDDPDGQDLRDAGPDLGGREMPMGLRNPHVRRSAPPPPHVPACAPSQPPAYVLHEKCVSCLLAHRW